MKIFYKYNGFTRSSELSTNFNGDYNYALLGSFDEDLWNLFGIFYVSESSSGESLEYVIEGFNEEGNGKTAPHEGATFEILRKMFGGIWKDVGSQEDFEALFKPQVERLTIKIVPNPELANDKDDIYTYLNPENRDILSCSSVDIKVPKSDIACIPVSLETTTGSTFIRDSKLTLSKNKGPRITIDTYYSGSIEGSIEYQKNLISTFYLAEDGVSYAFLPSMLVPSIPMEQEPTENFCGLNSEGLLFFNNTYYSLEEGFYDLKSINPETGPKLVRPEQIIAENTTIDFYPTPGLDKEFDTYYSLGGNDFGDPITIISCAKVVSSGPVIDCIPTAVSFRSPNPELNPLLITTSINGGPKETLSFYLFLTKFLMFSDDIENLKFCLKYVDIVNGSQDEGRTVISGFDVNGNIYKTDGSLLSTKSEISDLTGKTWDINKNDINTIKIYPTPSAGFDLDSYKFFAEKDDFGTPITIISCASITKSQDMICIPTNVTFSKEYHSIKPHIITVSRNGGPFITFDLNSSDLDKDLYFRTMSLSISGDGLAFVDGRENLYDYIVRGVINEPIFGISVDGSININESPVYLENEKIIYNHIIIEAPYIIQEETNWLTFIPTEGAHPDSDKFYKLYGNKENDQITVYSCAYLTKDWNNLPYIPTKYLI